MITSRVPPLWKSYVFSNMAIQLNVLFFHIFSTTVTKTTSILKVEFGGRWIQSQTWPNQRRLNEAQIHTAATRVLSPPAGVRVHLVSFVSAKGHQQTSFFFKHRTSHPLNFLECVDLRFWKSKISWYTDIILSGWTFNLIHWYTAKYNTWFGTIISYLGSSRCSIRLF